jgi:hypothetical protein
MGFDTRQFFTPLNHLVDIGGMDGAGVTGNRASQSTPQVNLAMALKAIQAARLQGNASNRLMKSANRPQGQDQGKSRSDAGKGSLLDVIA